MKCNILFILFMFISSLALQANAMDMAMEMDMQMGVKNQMLQQQNDHDHHAMDDHLHEQSHECCQNTDMLENNIADLENTTCESSLDCELHHCQISYLSDSFQIKQSQLLINTLVNNEIVQKPKSSIESILRPPKFII